MQQELDAIHESLSQLEKKGGLSVAQVRADFVDY